MPERPARTPLFQRRLFRVLPCTIGQCLVGVLMVLAVAYGALLRFDAITMKYGVVSRPAWLQSLQQSRGATSVLRPGSWSAVPAYPHADGPPTRYASDPYTYLKYAREMQSFYAAHRREPLFPFITKTFLGWLHNQDVAVSFASAACSVLAIVATLALGWYAFSWRVGLGAAVAIAIEYDIVSWGVQGLRDDAFMAAVVLFALALIRHGRAPSWWTAGAVGIVGGLACLVRITSLSFVVPGLVAMLWIGGKGWRERTIGSVIAAVGLLAVAAPFAVNCWRTFGDPLYAINVHADVYRAAEGQTVNASQTTTQYLGGQLRARPLQTLDTFVVGMTGYPFRNKWTGFGPWGWWVGDALAGASLIGLVLIVASPAGRLLIVVLAGSLIPYAPTWKVISDWRFTEHAYPFYVIAACVAIDRIGAVLARIPALSLTAARPTRRQLAFWASVVSVVVLGAWVVMRVLPYLVVREALVSGENASVEAGERDGAFFVSGWQPAVADQAISARVSDGERSVVRLPLPRADDYDVTLRLDPFPAPRSDAVDRLPSIRVFVNDVLIDTFTLAWNAERVGAYVVHVPRGLTSAWLNTLAIETAPKPRGPDRIRFWLARVRPVVLAQH